MRTIVRIYKDKISQNFVCYWKSDRIYNTMKNFRRNFSAIVNYQIYDTNMQENEICEKCFSK